MNLKSRITMAAVAAIVVTSAAAIAGCGGTASPADVTLHGTVTDTENVGANGCFPVTVHVRSDNVPVAQAAVREWKVVRGQLPHCAGTWKVSVPAANKAYQITVSDPLAGRIGGEIDVQPSKASKGIRITIGPGL